MENKQTAVEWLIKEIEKHYIINNGRLNPTTVMELKRQAKQIEKEQIIDAYTIGSYDMAEKEFRPEQYYTETYGR